MFKRLKSIYGMLVILVLISLIVSGCSSATPVTIEVTREVQMTVVVTQIVNIVVTATPPPPTPTVPITPTPVQTATPAFQKWTTSQVVKAFQDEGLESTGIRPMTKEDYGIAPMAALEGLRFFIPSMCADCGGRIFSYATQGDLDKMKTYYVTLGKSSAASFSWVFVKDNILVQINGDLKEVKAKQYEAALDAMK